LPPWTDKQILRFVQDDIVGFILATLLVLPASGLLQRHTAHNLSLRTEGQGDWDVEVVATQYRFDRDRQRTPTTRSSTDTPFGAAGRIAVLDGTGWSTFDAKAAWHRGGPLAAHTISAGVHHDRFRLANPTYSKYSL
jgi:iron complex outermembrane receptor protein